MLTDILPHITVQPAEQKAVPLAHLGNLPGLTSSRVERQDSQRKYLENWTRDVQVIGDIPGVVSVAPVVMGEGIISRGGKKIGTRITGADPERLNAVMPITKSLFAGKYLGLGASEVVLNYKTARDLGVATADRVRLTTTEGQSDPFTVVGIYDTGQNDAGASYISLRSAQSLFGTGTAVPTILVKGDSLYRADALADRIAALLPVEAKSWSREYPDILASMNAYDASAYLVSAFSLVASGFAIASTLIVSVVQKGRQIGILKGIGATSQQILNVFLLEGFFIAIIGATVGAGLGAALVHGLGTFRQQAVRPGAVGATLFPSDLTWQLVISAIGAAIVSTVLAAALPARRAAHLDPMEVLQ